jgi:hypothetical protein
VERYENPWRPNYEAAAVGMWLAVGATAWVTADWWDLHAAPFRYLAATGLVMAVLWLPGTLRVWRRHHRLRGRPLAFIAPSALERQVGRGADLWLGWGFDWTGEHAQLVHDLLRVGPARVIGLKSARLGADWIHGLGARERAVRLPLVHTEGHLLVVGTTGAGKAQPLTARVHTPTDGERWATCGLVTPSPPRMGAVRASPACSPRAPSRSIACASSTGAWSRRAARICGRCITSTGTENTARVSPGLGRHVRVS